MAADKTLVKLAWCIKMALFMAPGLLIRLRVKGAYLMHTGFVSPIQYLSPVSILLLIAIAKLGRRTLRQGVLVLVKSAAWYKIRIR